ncbi:MAG: M48 family metallopeptidase [Salibacteraceae bacterium]
MHNKIWLDLLKLIAIFSMLLLGFVYVPPMLFDDWKPLPDEAPALPGLSYKQEKVFGDFMVKQFLEDETLMSNPLIDSSFKVICNRLEQHKPLNEFDLTFHLLENEVVNAMTLPGGHIIVFSGLLSFADSPEEVAAVLAHEIGHVTKRHVANRLIREIGITAILAVITGGDVSIIHELSHLLLSNVFNREQESEADKFGLELLENVRIDPKALGVFFNRLNDADLAYDERLEWIMSHPHNNDRINASFDYGLNDSFVADSIDLNWSELKAEMEQL